MKSTKRFINTMVEEASKDKTVMPWARGKRRGAFIAKRTETAAPKLKAS